MTKQSIRAGRARWVLAVAGTAVLALGLAACGSDTATSPTSTAPVGSSTPGTSSSAGGSTSSGPSTAGSETGSSSAPTQTVPDPTATITVTGKPSDDQVDQLKVFNDRIAAFEKKHPTIKVIGSDKGFDAQTFNAMLAGGTLPDLYVTYFTDSLSVIGNQQAADVTDTLGKLGLTSQLNPTVTKLVTSADGKIYGLPFTAYGLGLVYNRALFTKAGLDPDKPPTTWDEVRAAAKTITEKTGVPGFATMGESNQGGWMLTAASYSFGGRMENEDGTQATFDTDQTKKYLNLLKAMRFEDKSIGDNVLYNQTTIGQALASGKVGMYVGAPLSYQDAVITYKMKPTDFGVGPMPQDGGTNGTLSGGGVFMVSPKASDDQKLAAMIYAKEVYLDTSLVESAAVDTAKANADQKLPVGLPTLSVLSDAKQDQIDGWIKPYVNVPTENFELYKKSLTTLPLLIEPPVKGQDLYASLAPVQQSVLTDQNADIAGLLQTAQTQFQAKLGR